MKKGLKIVFGGTKGGTGKTSSATNVAVMIAHNGKKVIVIDTDPSKNCAEWAETRKLLKPDLYRIEVAEAVGDVRNVMNSFAKDFDVVIVDAGGFDSRELRTAMGAADLLVIPLQPSLFDLKSLNKLKDMIPVAQEYNPNLKVLAVISQASTMPSISESEIQETREQLEKFPDIYLCETVIRDRKIFRDVIRDGRGVIESGDDKAATEIINFGKEIFSYVQR